MSIKRPPAGWWNRVVGVALIVMGLSFVTEHGLMRWIDIFVFVVGLDTFGQALKAEARSEWLCALQRIADALNKGAKRGAEDGSRRDARR